MASRFSIRGILINMDSRIQLIFMGAVVGIVSGSATILLTTSLGFLSGWILQLSRPWIFIVSPAGGILLTVVFLKFIVKDYGGHGVPEVIYSVGMQGGRLNLRSSFSKLIGSLLTLASGASAGPEAPVVISGAAIGSNIAGYFKSNEKIRVAVVGSGAAAAIASIFNAPIAGIIFTMEVILGEWTSVNLLPVAIASATGTIVSRIFNGNQIPFLHKQFQIGLTDIAASAGLAFLTAICAIALIRALRTTSKILKSLFKSDLAKALVGGLGVGGMVFFFAEVRGEGYETIRSLIEGRVSHGAAIILVLIGLKIAATSLTLDSGGAGGVFAPSLVIGSLCGFFYFQATAWLFPQASLAPAGFYALVGMAGALGGTLQAPLTGTFLILEITQGYDAIIPLLIVSFLSSTLVRLVEKHSIYHQELIKKGLFLRPRTDASILLDLSVEELLETDCSIIHPDMTLHELLPVIQKSTRNYFPVVEKKTGCYLGMVTLNEIKAYLFDPRLASTILVEEVMRADIETVSPGDRMTDILRKFDRSHAWSLPVVKDQKFLGLLSKATLLDHYRKELIAQTDL